MLLPFTTENNDVLSAKSFTVHSKLSDKSKVQGCSTPALTGNHSDVYSFSSTFWNLLLKKSSMRRKSVTSTDLSLNITYQAIHHQSQE